jgi:phosphopantetheinyl transferase
MQLSIDKVRMVVEELCISLSVCSAVVDIDKVKNDITNGFTADNILTNEEKKLYDGCRILKRKADWLSGRIAAKRAVTKMLGLRQSQVVEILRYDSGAPFVTGHTEISVSIAHSGSYAVAAVAPFKIGIDLELLELRPESFVRSVLSSRELESLIDKNGDNYILEVNRLWTCKEAVSKVHQWGGNLNFKMIDCCDNPVLVDGKSIYYKCRNSEMHAVTIAYEGYRGSNG